MTEQDRPVGTKTRQEPIPVHIRCATKDQMGDVRAVESLPLHNKRLHPDHFFGRTQADFQTENLCWPCPFEPEIVHTAEAIAGPENDVDRFAIAKNFAQPVRMNLLHMTARTSKNLQSGAEILRPDEQIK